MYGLFLPKINFYFCIQSNHPKYTILLIFPKELPIRKTRLFKYIENFATKKGKFSDKNPDIFHMSAQKYRLWYSNEYPHLMCVFFFFFFFFSRIRK